MSGECSQWGGARMVRARAGSAGQCQRRAKPRHARRTGPNCGPIIPRLHLVAAGNFH